MNKKDVVDEVEIDLMEILYVIKGKLLLIILAGLLFAMASGIVSNYVLTPEYKSTSKLYILTQSTSITSLADIQVGESLTYDYMELIKSRPVVEQVIEDMNLKMSYEQLVSKIAIENPTDTRILKISIKDKDPLKAKDIANDFAYISKKRISEIMKTEEPTIVEDAIVSKNPVSPNKRMNIAIAFLLGLILSMIYFILVFIFDDTIKHSEDVEKYLGLNTLAVIPLDKELEDIE